VIDGGHEPILQLLLGGDPDMAQHGPRQLGKEPLDQVQPGAVRRGEGEREAAGGLSRKPGAALPGDMRRMVVQESRMRWIAVSDG
jgi:hypothetical protein